MALIFRGKSQCVLCGEVLHLDDAIVTTSPFIEDDSHPLYEYADAGMHKTCFLGWEKRESFIRTFNQYFEKHYRGLRHMTEDGEILERELQ